MARLLVVIYHAFVKYRHIHCLGIDELSIKCDYKSIIHVVRPMHHLDVRTVEIIASVNESVHDNPNFSIPQCPQQLGL